MCSSFFYYILQRTTWNAWTPECQTYLKFSQNISHTIVQNFTEDHLGGFGSGFSFIIIRAGRCIQSHWTLLNATEPCSESAQYFSPTNRRSGIQPLMSNHLFIKLVPYAWHNNIGTLRQKHEEWYWFAKVKGTRKTKVPFVASCRSVGSQVPLKIVVL